MSLRLGKGNLFGNESKNVLYWNVYVCYSTVTSFILTQGLDDLDHRRVRRANWQRWWTTRKFPWRLCRRKHPSSASGKLNIQWQIIIIAICGVHYCDSFFSPTAFDCHRQALLEKADRDAGAGAASSFISNSRLRQSWPSWSRIHLLAVALHWPSRC